MASLPTPRSLFLDRRAAGLGLLAVLAAGAARAAPCRPPQVLFVCPAGSVKSAIARETLKRQAAARGLKVGVRSRGLVIENHVSPELAAHLREDGLDPAAEPLQALSDADVAQADIVIAFDEAAQDPRLKGARIWQVPSWKDYPAAKAALAAQMGPLVAELAARERRPCGGG